LKGEKERVPVGKIAKKKQSEVVFLLTRHSKYSANQKYTPTDCFFGNFAHWLIRSLIKQTCF